MCRPISRSILLCLVVCGYLPPVQSQSEFGVARSRLQQLASKEFRAKTAADKADLQKDLEAIPIDVRGLISQGVLDALNGGATLSAEDLQNKIIEALPGGDEQVAFVFLLLDRSYLVIYNLVFCSTCSRSWIGVFSPNSGGNYRIASELDNPMQNQSLKVAPLWLGDDAESFVPYGTDWGDAHNRLNIMAYSFDRSRITAFWSRTGLVQGAAQIREGTLELSYLSSLWPPWKKVNETYSLGRAEVHLERASEVPERRNRAGRWPTFSRSLRKGGSSNRETETQIKRVATEPPPFIPSTPTAPF